MFKNICFVFVMKKYQKLLLCILAVFGTLGFLIYHSQYVKLRSTFDGFNIVGDSLWTSERCLVLNTSCFNVEDEKKRLDFPPVSWTNISQFHVFSSFVDSNDQRFNVRAIGAGPPPDSESSLMDMECHIWMSYRNSLHSTRGTFTFSALRLTSPLSPRLYEFYCVVDVLPQGTPYSLVLTDRRNRKKTFVPIKDVRSSSRDSSVLCILPESLGLNMNSLVEFVSFHQIAGFTDIIIYDVGIHFGVLSTMASILRKINAFKSFSVIRWDFPFMDHDLSVRLVERECQYRASGSAKFVVVTSWYDYIVPVSPKSVTALSVPGNVNAKAVLPAVRCCLNHKDDVKSVKTWPIALRKTACSDDTSGSIVIVNPRLDTTDSLKNGGSGVTVFKYVDCERSEMRNIVRNSKASAFTAELMSSDILRIWKSGKYYL